MVELVAFTEDFARGKIVKTRENRTEPEIGIHLAQALPKDKNMEMVVRRGTEIGLKKIIPVTTERTVVQLNKKKEEKRKARWSRIAREAAKQSRRGMIPRIDDLHSVKEVGELASDYDLALLMWAGEQACSLKEVLNDLNYIPDKVLVLIGPEGGFSSGEVKVLTEKFSFKTAGLGPRILRTETAGLVVLSLILYQFNEM